MGLFDFLKVSVGDGKGKTPAPARRLSGNAVEFDGKRFPLTAITTKGFSAGSFDGSLIRGQTARLTVKVDDESGKFSFPATVAINDADGGKLVGEWSMLSPEVEGVIRKYLQIRKQKTGK